MSFSEEDVCDILKKNSRNILGNPVSEAVKGIQETVEQLVKKAELPDEIAIRYKAFAGDESLLYSSESYRDHFFHSFHTFLLGFLLLSKLKLSQQNKPPFPLDDYFLKKWLLTSLWHDITYAAEMGPSWLAGFIKGRLEFYIRADQDWGPILGDIDNVSAIGKLSLRFENKSEERRLIFHTWLNKQIEERHDHGVLSAILLLRDAEKQKWKLDEKLVNECSLAIALHNYHNALSGDKELIKKGKLGNDKSPACKLGSLAIKDYPLAFLLAYCDTAQEWGRPSGKQTTNYSTYNGVKVEKNNKKIYILLEYSLSKFIEFKKNNMGKIYLPTNDIFIELVNEESEKFEKMRNTWKSDKWKYYIQLIGLIEKDEVGRRNVMLAEYEK